MLITLERIPIDGRLPRPCEFEVCELDASVYVTAPDVTREDDGVHTYTYDKTPLCTGHAHVIVAETMVGL